MDAERLLHILGEQCRVELGRCSTARFVKTANGNVYRASADNEPLLPVAYWIGYSQDGRPLRANGSDKLSDVDEDWQCPTFAEALRRADLANERMVAEGVTK